MNLCVLAFPGGLEVALLDRYAEFILPELARNMSWPEPLERLLPPTSRRSALSMNAEWRTGFRRAEFQAHLDFFREQAIVVRSGIRKRKSRRFKQENSCAIAAVGCSLAS
jgi:hypothetical protein